MRGPLVAAASGLEGGDWHEYSFSWHGRIVTPILFVHGNLAYLYLQLE